LRRDGATGDKPAIKITNRRMLAWFYKNLVPHWHKVALGVAAMVISAGAGLYVPQIMKGIFDQVVTPGFLSGQAETVAPGTSSPLPHLIVLLLVFMLGGQFFGALRTLVMHLLGQRFVYTVRADLYRHLLGLGLNYFETERSGDIMSRISNDVGAVEDLVVHGSDDIISNTIQVFGAVAILFWMDWRLSLVALSPLPLYVAGLWTFSHYIRPVFAKIRKELGDINAKLQERIGGIRVVKAFAREEAEIAFFDESNRAYWRLNAKSTWMWSTFFPALSLITSAGLAATVWYAAKRSGQGVAPVTSGTIFAFYMYLNQFYRPVGSLANIQNTINRALASIARIFELTDKEPSVKDKPGAIELGRVEGRVDVQNVCFQYDTGEGVLENVSVSAAPGEKVAIVGRSGAGKTSLVNLIARFYDPTAGRVLIDGHDARDVTQRSLRANIGMVLQETFLFNATAKENILYARPHATDEEVIAAARGAYAHDFISRLEHGYDTLIGERGVRLSGGEKQRLAIARAFLADPRILILDEATSMVDTEAERIIQRALEELIQGRTTFIIAHRLSTVRKADKIVVIDAGQVVEQDRHDALMAKGGLYAEMVARQFRIDDDLDVAVPEVL
jgi:ABC-type multidrug transport system fused ATPase/permease subunit